MTLIRMLGCLCPSYFLIVHLLIDSKNGRKPIVGVAHHVSFTRPYGLFDVAAVALANSLTLFTFIDSICDKLDFIGINYYGQVT
jgi:galactolipid galactosyltransferase